MKILVLNSGSSSIKCQYFMGQKSIAETHIERIGEETSHSEIRYGDTKETDTARITDHHHALSKIFTMLKTAGILSDMKTLDAVGHRVVHGGDIFKEPTRINKEVIETISSLIPLAPLHNPANLEGIEAMYTRYPELPQIAVFDTAYHQTIPEYAALYPLPYALSQTAKIRRYGFHGTSHLYVAKEAAKIMGRTLRSLNLITLHLGNGASATAIRSGISIDTSMGMTPLEGLMMGTRCGDIDPAIIPYLAHNTPMDIDRIDTMLNKESGLKGICGSNDMREILARAAQGDKSGVLALDMYVYRIKKYIGAYTVALGKVDAVIFTGGIGEHAAKVREMVCEGLDQSIGLKIDPLKNQSDTGDAQALHSSESKIQLFTIPTNEELEIVLQTEKMIKEEDSIL